MTFNTKELEGKVLQKFLLYYLLLYGLSTLIILMIMFALAGVRSFMALFVIGFIANYLFGYFIIRYIILKNLKDDVIVALNKLTANQLVKKMFFRWVLFSVAIGLTITFTLLAIEQFINVPSGGDFLAFAASILAFQLSFVSYKDKIFAIKTFGIKNY